MKRTVSKLLVAHKKCTWFKFYRIRNKTTEFYKHIIFTGTGFNICKSFQLWIIFSKKTSLTTES